MYQVRRFKIGTSSHLQELSHACGELYTQTLVFFWRTVRHKGIWLKPKHLMRLFTSEKLHAHTSDACVQAFFASLKSWRERRKTDPAARPPRKREWYFRVEYKRSAMRLADGKLTLSNGRGTALIETLYREGVSRLVIGDVRDIRQDLDVGSKQNQRLHQWSHGSVRHKLTYKAERRGMAVVSQEESSTSKTCPQCGKRRKSAVKERNFVCHMGAFRFHHDGVGAMNIRYTDRKGTDQDAKDDSSPT